MTGVAIECRALSKRWGESVAVDGISFSAPAGAFTVLLGPSGCGKSTTLRLIAGLEEASDGQVLIGDRDVTRMPPNDRQIAMVFQSYALFPHLNVAENIIFGLKVRRVPAADRQARLMRVSEMLGLSELLERRPSQLSGGQQQRVALGRAIIAEKPICLMDEPLSNLDAKLRHEMRIELRALQRKLGITMVYVTHDQAEAIAMADKIVVLNQGRIEQAASPREIYNRPSTAFTARFIGTPPMSLMALEKQGAAWSIAGSDVQVDTPFDASGAEALVLGLRPETVRIDATGDLPAEVEAVEYLGADSLLDCRIGSERLTVREPNRHDIRAGEVVQLTWPRSQAHYFDPSTGRRLEPASSEGDLASQDGSPRGEEGAAPQSYDRAASRGPS